jgi:hypothetical protein
VLSGPALAPDLVRVRGGVDTAAVDGSGLRVGVVLRVEEERVEVRGLGWVPFVERFPAPRRERVSPGHLVAVLGGVVVWRWYDAVVVEDAGGGSLRVWEPAHGEVLARLRDGGERARPGERAYVSAGLPGADWWVADRVRDEPRVELDAVAALYR